MEIVRIDSYEDTRFSQKVLTQHGCFLVDNIPYEVEIISECEAIVRGEKREKYKAIIEEFRFYTPHIYKFYDEVHHVVCEYPKVELFDLRMQDIQPSQFYVDSQKVEAVKTFISSGKDIIIQVMHYRDKWVSLDGHTRLYYAHLMGYESVRAIEAEVDESICGFVEEAIKRGITAPSNMELVNHEEYVVKWHRFCDEYFGRI